MKAKTKAANQSCVIQQVYCLMTEKHLFCEILRDLFAVTNHSLAAVFFAVEQITSINYS